MPNNLIPESLYARLEQLNPPANPVDADPTDVHRVLMANNISGARFSHEDGDVLMGVYVLGSDPETKEGVGVAVIFLADDMRMFRRAESIQGCDLEVAQRELLEDYVATFHRPAPTRSPGMGN